MPELPEVETIARGVHQRICGDRIVETWFSKHQKLFKPSAAEQAKGLEGCVFLDVHRAGKHIVCELGASSTSDLQFQWIVHLGMTGRLLIATPDSPLAKHTHVRLSLASGRELRFVDPRRFGRVELRNLSCSKAFSAPGADPLLIEAREFAALFHPRKLTIKAALLNQTLLAGVGNIYADESLFRAGIRPRKMARRLTGAELERLRLALREVLQHAIRLGGSSVSNYVDADGMRGFFQLEHCVYQRTGQPCRNCQTPIQKILLAGRSTHYCPRCQR